MKRTWTFFLGAALLTACSSSGPSTNLPTDQDTIPYVPRTIASTYTCPTGTVNAGALSAYFGPDMLDRGNLIKPGASPQATSGNSVWDLLYETKVLINTLYYGYSTVDLQAKHDEAYQNFKKTFPNALSTYPITSQVDDLMNTYLNSIGDDHTYYMNAKEYDAFRGAGNNAPQETPVFGIYSWPVAGQDGAYLYDVRGDGSAFAAGLRRGDVILSVDGVPLKRTVQAKVENGVTNDSEQARLYAEMISAAAQKKTAVQVVVRRGNVQRTVTMTGQLLNATLYPWGEMKTDSDGNKVYYLRIPSFLGLNIAQKVHDLVRQAQTQGANRMVVDLRNNYGGNLREYVAAAGAFTTKLPDQILRAVDASTATFNYQSGRVTYVESCKTPETDITLNNPALWTGKVAVLLNSYSASASEMFSQNLYLLGAATLIGEKTFGVGNTVTDIYQTPNAAVAGGPNGSQAISLTTARMYFGDQVAPKSVTPEISVPDDEAALAATGTDTALETAFTTLR